LTEFEGRGDWKQMNMIKTVEIVSLSSGIIGESFVSHELKIGVERLKTMGLQVKFSEHALKGIDYINEHPEDRAADLIEAYADPEVDMILCAIGGDDTYRLLPYLFDNDELKKVVNDKIFLGFSDTTMNHFMLHKLGINTFYGQCFMADICELDDKMLPYTEKYFKELITTGKIKEVRPSDVWYEERTAFDESQVGVPRVKHPNKGFELLQGPAVFSGKILGGCIESMYDIFNNDRYSDIADLCEKYKLFPALDDWKGRILLLESSEEKPTPDLYEKMLIVLKEYGIFDVVSGVLVGKPMDETYADEYKELLVRIIDSPDLPVLYDINIGHATPRCIIPFGVSATVDADKQVITFE
jgi:muramoyltetrapeptide carboxypeptidase LdcA involved in peptidoglycan recycling